MMIVSTFCDLWLLDQEQSSHLDAGSRTPDLGYKSENGRGFGVNGLRQVLKKRQCYRVSRGQIVTFSQASTASDEHSLPAVKVRERKE